MTFRLHRLYSEPEVFDPIDFHLGVNLILGERIQEEDSAEGRKVNGVGKSLCVEFLHFGLLREFSKTRVAKIPEEVLPEETTIILIANIGRRQVEIRRSLNEPDQPKVLTAGRVITFDSLSDAQGFLADLFFVDRSNAGQVTFRQVMSLLMREESSGFSDILNPFGGRAKRDMAPHLYLLGIDLGPYRSLMRTIEKLSRQRKVLRSLKSSLEESFDTKIRDIPAQLNRERRVAEEIDEALNNLRADPAFESVEEDLVDIERKLVSLRGERRSLTYEIDQIRSIPMPEQIDADDLEILYDRIQEGLGELVKKSLDEVQAFKNKLDAFQRSLRERRLSSLIEDRKDLGRQISKLSGRHAEITNRIDRRGVLGELKTGLEEAGKRSERYTRLEAQFSQYEELHNDVEEVKSERENELGIVRKQLKKDCRQIEGQLDETISSFHNRIMGNSEASFKFQITDSKQSVNPISIDCRIYDDGSYGINRDRTFLYDFSLLFNPDERSNHPGFLLHDNILEVDQDTVYRVLNFLHDQTMSGEDFQYVLTLNRDKISSEEAHKEIRLDIEKSKVAVFTKERQFLKRRYQEK